MSKFPLLSICSITYNHDKFIRDTINGVLLQKTDFDIELVIGEDCSTDNTRLICNDYAAKYPELIKLLPSIRNIGISQNFIRTIQACKGQYIAICEGDDYWTDHFKLQKQVDFLKANKDHGMVHTGANVVNSNGELIFISNDPKPNGDVFLDLLKSAFIITCSVCIRTEIIKPLTKRAVNENLWYIMDYWFWAHCAMQSKVHYIQEITSAYRSHENGISKNKNKFFQKRLPLINLDIIKTRLNYNRPNSLSLAWKLSSLFCGSIIGSRYVPFKEKKVFLPLIIKHPWLLIGIFPSLFSKFKHRMKTLF